MSVLSVTSTRTPSWRSTSFTFSSCCPSSSRKSRGSAKWSSVGVSARGTPTGLLSCRTEEIVRRDERRVEPARVLAPCLGEVRAAAPAAAHHRGELLDDVAGVEAAGEILGDRGEQQHPIVADGPEDHHARADALTQTIGHVAQALVVEIVDARGKDRGVP